MLAQQSISPTFWIALGSLIVVVMGAGLFILFMRRRLLGRPGDADQGTSLLEELRDMKERGELSKEEFDRTRASMIGRVAGAPDHRELRQGAVVARPGYDLTGAPLPPPSENEPPSPSDSDLDQPDHGR